MKVTKHVEFKPFSVCLTFESANEVQLWTDMIRLATDKNLPGSCAMYRALLDEMSN